MEYSLEVSTSTSRYLLERHSGTDARGKRFPWKRIAQFDSYNDAERVLELIQRGQDNAVHFEGDVVKQAVTTDDIYAVFPFDLTEYPKALAEVQRLLLTIAELQAEVERLAAWKTEGLAVLDEWDEVAAMCPSTLGTTKASQVKAHIARLTAENGGSAQ